MALETDSNKLRHERLSQTKKSWMTGKMSTDARSEFMPIYGWFMSSEL